MLQQLSLNISVSCTPSPTEYLHRPVRINRQTHVRCLSLTARSETCTTELESVLSTCDHKQREALQHISEPAYQTFRDCPVNQSLSHEALVSLLLRIAALRYLWQQQYSHDSQKLQDINCMVKRVAVLTDLLAGGSSEQTLQTIE